MREKTAGKDWFDLPAPRAADLPRLYREVEALRMRNQLDPKRFYRKDEGEGKGVKGLPKHFAVRLSANGLFSTRNTDFVGQDRANTSHFHSIWRYFRGRFTASRAKTYAGG